MASRLPSFLELRVRLDLQGLGQAWLRRGDTVCVVGEWSGDTGDVELESQLRGSFHLTRRLPLPNWTDTVHELTIWQRASSRGEGTPGGLNLLPVACSGCSTGCSGGITPGRAALEASSGPVDGTAVAGGSGSPLRRCRFCREVAYCSTACAEADGKRHAEAHALRLIFFSDHQAVLASDADYAALSRAEA